MQENTIYSPVYLLLMRLGLLIIFFSISISSFAQNEVQEFERLDLDKVRADLDTIKAEIDSTLYYINSIFQIIKEQHKLIGWRKTIHILLDTFLPVLIFVALYFFG